MEKCNKIAALYVATLKSMALIHQQSHWLTKGIMFFGNHLLFSRLYESVQDDLDLAAEKFVGIFGEECLTYEFQTELLNGALSKYNNLEGSPVEMSLAIEKDFLKLTSQAYGVFQAEGKMTLGLDDMLMSIASNREEAVYLLQQCLK